MLIVNQLSKLHGPNQGIDQVSFEVGTKEICAVVGSNGSGKTTLFRTLLGLYHPDSGAFTYHSKKPKSLVFGYLPEERSVISDLKTHQCIRLFAQLKNMKNDEIELAMHQWMSRLKCLDLMEKTLKQCSKGNQQKIQLITAIIHNPDILILDEPLTGLDIDNAMLFKSIIYQLKQSGKTILLSSHRYEEIENLCDRLLVLKQSKVEIFSDIAMLKNQSSKRTITVSDDPFAQYVFEKGVIDVMVDNKLTHYVIQHETDAIKLMRKLLRERDNRSVKMTSLTLEDLVKKQT